MELLIVPKRLFVLLSYFGHIRDSSLISHLAAFAFINMLTSTQTVPLFQGVSETNSGVGVIPANTQLQTALSVRPATETQKAHVELSISTPNGTVF